MDEKTHLALASRGFSLRRSDAYAHEYAKDYMDEKGRLARATIYLDPSGPAPDCLHVAVQATFKLQDIDLMPAVVQADATAIRAVIAPIATVVVQVKCHECGNETNEFYRAHGKVLCRTCLG